VYVDTVDGLDRALVHALQIDGRAPFRRIAAVLGVADQTIARRYARLSRARLLQVVGVTDPDLLAAPQWIVRLRASPSAAQQLGAALARREDTSWINFCGAGSDIVFAGSGRSAETLLSDTLSRTRTVFDIRAERVLHTFYGAHTGPYLKRGPLTPEQVSLLAVGAPEVQPRAQRLDDTDRLLMTTLRHDGRTSVEDLAATTGQSSSTVRRRLQTLLTTGAVRLDVDVDAVLLDAPLRAMLWVRVDVDQLRDAGSTLARQPETTFVAAVTGQAGLFVSLVVRDPADLFEYLSARLPEVTGVAVADSAVVLRHLKGASITAPASLSSSATRKP
jgi:DNA-binding Lrp family transcriptional regulator